MISNAMTPQSERIARIMAMDISEAHKRELILYGGDRANKRKFIIEQITVSNKNLQTQTELEK